jgi:hypothetical protein
MNNPLVLKLKLMLLIWLKFKEKTINQLMITSLDLAKIQRKDNNVVDLITFAFFASVVHLSTKNLPFSLRLHVTSIYHHKRIKVLVEQEYILIPLKSPYIRIKTRDMYNCFCLLFKKNISIIKI